MADIKNVNLDGTLYNYKDEKARNDISDLKEDYESLGLSVVDGMLCVTYEEV